MFHRNHTISNFLFSERDLIFMGMWNNRDEGRVFFDETKEGLPRSFLWRVLFFRVFFGRGSPEDSFKNFFMTRIFGFLTMNLFDFTGSSFRIMLFEDAACRGVFLF